MSKRFPFLTARWSNLALITYDVDAALLAPHVPPGCALDLLDGRAFVSLVAFDFLDTRVMGVKWPGFVNFPEINLRYYLRGPDGKRGVSFVRELVPSRFIAYMARTIYNEPYLACPMRSRIEQTGDSIAMEHVAEIAGREQHIRVGAASSTWLPAEDSREHFFKEHDMGYGVTRGGRLITYEVNHPRWSVYGSPRIDSLEWDFAGVYGQKWAILRGASPFNITFAVGSAVSVFPKGTTAIEKSAEAIGALSNASR